MVELVVTCKGYEERKLFCGFVSSLNVEIPYRILGRGRTKKVFVQVDSPEWIRKLQAIDLVESVEYASEHEARVLRHRLRSTRATRVVRPPLDASEPIELAVIRILCDNLSIPDPRDQTKILERVGRVSKRLDRNQDDWKSRLSFATDALMGLLAHSEATPQISEISRKMIWSTIRYVYEVDDVIPDHQMGVGYVDDAFAVNYCIGVLRKEDREAHDWVLERLRG